MMLVRCRSVVVCFVLIVCTSAGCATKHRHTAKHVNHRATRASFHESGLQIARIGADGCASGIPISADTVITAAHVLDYLGPHASVDGYPMQSTNFRYSNADHHRPPVDDWAVLRSERPRFATNTIDLAPELRAGDVVVFGGYRGSDAPRNIDALIDFHPLIETGVVLEGKDNCGCDSGTVPIAIDIADFIGFSGGPVATWSADEGYRVWGIIVAGIIIHPLNRPWTKDRLCVLPLSEVIDVVETIQSLDQFAVNSFNIGHLRNIIIGDQPKLAYSRR